MLSALLFRRMALGWLLLLSTLSSAQSRPGGTGLRGQYYEGLQFGHLVLTRTDPGIDFNWTIGPTGDHFVSPGPGVPGEEFSVRWSGYVYAPVTGSYAFQMSTDDGMRVWVGGKRILNSWQNQQVSRYSANIVLTAGRYYPIRVEYYQASRDSKALLEWQLPGATAEFAAVPATYLYTRLPPTAKPLPVGERSVASSPGRASGTIGIVPGAPVPKPTPMRLKPPTNVPEAVAASAMVPAARGIGLRATYFAGPDNGAGVLSRIEPVVQVTWQQKPPVPQVPAQGFSVRWTGYVLAPESGVYVFHTEFDDAHDVTFAVDDILSMKKFDKEFFNKTPVPLDFAQRLTAGRWYKVSITYRQVEGLSRALFSWTRPGATNRTPVVVPQQYLYPDLPVNKPVAAAAPPAVMPRPQPALPRPLGRRPAGPQPSVTRRVRQAPRQVVSLQPSPPDSVLPLPDFRTLRAGTAITLPNLYFTQSTANLLPASRPVLNALARRLHEQPTLRLEIAGHTDNVGDAALNLRLSQQRARVVRQYLVQQGIDSVRLVARGYGGTRPVADNRDPQQRPRNRRVEVVVP